MAENTCTVRRKRNKEDIIFMMLDTIDHKINKKMSNVNLSVLSAKKVPLFNSRKEDDRRKRYRIYTNRQGQKSSRAFKGECKRKNAKIETELVQSDELDKVLI
jgi:hypothetical protein